MATSNNYYENQIINAINAITWAVNDIDHFDDVRYIKGKCDLIRQSHDEYLEGLGFGPVPTEYRGVERNIISNLKRLRGTMAEEFIEDILCRTA